MVVPYFYVFFESEGCECCYKDLRKEMLVNNVENWYNYKNDSGK